MVVVYAILSILLTLSILQLVMALNFKSQLIRGTNFDEEQELVPLLASIVLSVRGCDPTLRHSLIGLLDQDYENYEIHVVVDNRVDTAWKVVHEIKEEFDLDHRLTIHEMREPLETCGLKCSALIQALDAIHEDSTYLVLLDADVKPHRTWLSSCIRPLQADAGIGVVTGNQWFEPLGESTGTLIRSLWNAGAIVPTAMYANPWAGTCAMRVDDVHRSGLDLLWRKSVVDDGPIRDAMTPLGLRVHFEPSLIMINREHCSTEYVGRYISRMLTWSKLYEKTFINTVVHAAISNGAFCRHGRLPVRPFGNTTMVLGRHGVRCDFIEFHDLAVRLPFGSSWGSSWDRCRIRINFVIDFQVALDECAGPLHPVPLWSFMHSRHACSPGQMARDYL